MATCPNGHESADADYCDVCGALIGGVQQTTAPASDPSGAAAAPAPPATSAAGTVSGTGADPGTGAASGSPVGAGHATAGAGPGTAPTGGTSPTCPACDAPRTGRFCEECGFDFTSAAVPPRVPPTAELPSTPPGQPTGGWSVTVVADRDYHRAVADRADDESEAVPFPAYCPERRFALTGGQLLIGRRSRSRGIVPDIDLTGPPEDTGVSHVHALLVASGDGWELVDPGSTNGTRLNGAEDPVPENSPVRLADGDRIHVGAWTTITIHTAS
ncbi:hypothetical protein Lfu02_08620 [Longispora fulva]|uniref:FHA domain-containing protein n=1 Tax=Longispora fulva TaxID=619741 RepID=A0A8J7GQV9_9ACTN|nr:FHA domain-containing protein [Longispora fulva]MBG6135271.1 hypothetical protein [Longispora fulva]GIG56490.1 hypothetical protein Lfu02_08620 [Longispora fulva]